MEIALFWFAFAVAVGVYADRLHRSGIGWFFGAVVLSPILAAILLLAMGKGEETGTRACPHCAETVKVAAVICKHCHKPLTSESAPAPAAEPVAAAPAASAFTETEKAAMARQDSSALVAVGGGAAVVIGIILLASYMTARPTSEVPRSVSTAAVVTGPADVCAPARDLITRAFPGRGAEIPGVACENMNLAEQWGGWNGTAVVMANDGATPVRHVAEVRLEQHEGRLRLCRLSYGGAPVETLAGC